MKQQRYLTIGLFFAFLLFVSNHAYAGGFQIYQAGSAEAKALGGAVVGRDDLISNAWYNPAALTNFKTDKSMSGVSFVNLTQKYEPGNGLDSMSLNTDRSYLPNSHWVHRASKDVVFALSSSVPFGLGTKWQNDDLKKLLNSGSYNQAPAGGVTQSISLAQKAELQVPYMNGSLAAKVSKKLSLAGGLSLIRADLKLRFLSRATAGAATLWDKAILYHADGTGFGWLAAAHYNADDSLKFGLRYMSKAQIEMTGSVEDHPIVGNTAVRGHLNLPARLTLGTSYELFEGLKLSCDVLWTEWKDYKELRIDNATSWTSKGGFVSDKSWENTLSYHFGVEYDYSEKWAFRLGYSYENSPIPDRTRNLELPGADGHLYAIGIGRKGSKWNWDLAYSYMHGPTTVAGIDALNGQGSFTDGTNQFLSLSLTKMF